MASMAEPSVSQEPMARGSIIHGFRAAAVALWGEDALRAVADRLPAGTRAGTLEGAIVLPVAWIPTAFVVDWQLAVWEGLARRDDPTFCRFLDRGIDFGFGAFRRAFLKLVTPEQLVAKAPDLWKKQHTHGTLTASPRSEHAGRRTVVLSLRDSPMVENQVSRRAMAEIWRYIATFARVKEVRETHGLEGSALVARVTWAA
jgi:hypothetical protein